MDTVEANESLGFAADAESMNFPPRSSEIGSDPDTAALQQSGKVKQLEESESRSWSGYPVSRGFQRLRGPI